MKRRRIDPNRVMLGMMPRTCAECKQVQHVFFKSQDEFDTWDCPECRKERGELEGDIEQPETECE